MWLAVPFRKGTYPLRFMRRQLKILINFSLRSSIRDFKEEKYSIGVKLGEVDLVRLTTMVISFWEIKDMLGDTPARLGGVEVEEACIEVLMEMVAGLIRIQIMLIILMLIRVDSTE